MSAIVILLIIIAVIAIIFVLIYNSLITKRNRVQEGWSDVEVQLKRRYDLIPNLVSTVKGYASHERETLTKVTEMRANALQASGTTDQAKSENMLTGALKSLFAVSENYPDLKASENFNSLQQELADTENKIQAARRFYNSTVQDFNTAMQVFPTNLFATALSFKIADFFELDDDDREKAEDPVAVSF